MTDTNTSSMTWMGALVFIIIFFLIFRTGLGTGAVAEAGCSRVSNCEVERRGIIDSATTNYNVLDQGAKNRMEILASEQRLGTKIDFYAYDNLKIALADEKAKNIALEGKFYQSEKFNELNQANNLRFYALERALDQKPNAYPCYAPTASPCGQVFPNGCAA